MKAVYIINGFLESGKTEFITFTMQQPYFRSKGKTLLLLCEEGENEYDEELLAATNTVVEVIESSSDLNSSNSQRRPLQTQSPVHRMISGLGSKLLTSFNAHCKLSLTVSGMIVEPI